MQQVLLKKITPNTVHLWRLSSHQCVDAMRQILSCYVGPILPAIKKSAYGKPYLAESDLEFNLSHSGDYALLAITRGQAVGVDIEHMCRKTKDFLAIAKRFFTAEECSAIQFADDPHAAFFRCWVRKEAFIKATGLGLSFGLSNVVVSVDVKAQLINVNDDTKQIHQWTLRDITLDFPDYIAAVVVFGKIDSVVWQSA